MTGHNIVTTHKNNFKQYEIHTPVKRVHIHTEITNHDNRYIMHKYLYVGRRLYLYSILHVVHNSRERNT